VDRAEGTSVWRVGGHEINAEDDVRLEDDGAVWYMEAVGTGQTAIVRGMTPGARQFVREILRQKARMAQRQVVHPAPKPPRSRRRQGPPERVECPACNGTGKLDCAGCGGDGWVLRQG